mmetsp:Transcript_75328/g.243597  ORF Transcript_75328/g.243597 Transcript_75328/m.243597 type:complete len:212 (+) Transcript_75328:1344-1979(+)
MPVVDDRDVEVQEDVDDEEHVQQLPKDLVDRGRRPPVVGDVQGRHGQGQEHDGEDQRVPDLQEERARVKHRQLIAPAAIMRGEHGRRPQAVPAVVLHGAHALLLQEARRVPPARAAAAPRAAAAQPGRLPLGRVEHLRVTAQDGQVRAHRLGLRVDAQRRLAGALLAARRAWAGGEPAHGGGTGRRVTAVPHRRVGLAAVAVSRIGCPLLL